MKLDIGEKERESRSELDC